MDIEKTGGKTIKELADSTRLKGLQTYGEARFAQMCLDFDRIVPPLDDNIRITLVFRLMAALNASDKDYGFKMQMALVWLDGHGYGGYTMYELAEVLARLRLQQPQ